MKGKALREGAREESRMLAKGGLQSRGSSVDLRHNSDSELHYRKANRYYETRMVLLLPTVLDWSPDSRR
jgi:hypothetical protein